MSLSGYNCQSVLILVSSGVVKCWQNTTVNDLIKALRVHLILGLQAWTSDRWEVFKRKRRLLSLLLKSSNNLNNTNMLSTKISRPSRDPY